MTERRFFPLRRDSHTDAEWDEEVIFLARHQLDPNNIPTGEQIIWDDDAQTITVIEWIRDANGKLRISEEGRPMARPITIHVDWDGLPTTWQEAALGGNR